MQILKFTLFYTLFLAMILQAHPVAAQFTLTLSPVAPTLLPGDSSTFQAYLRNNTGGEVFLNNDQLVFSGNGIAVNDVDFVFNAPLSLADGEEWQGDVFTVSIASFTTPDTYTGTFSIIGGADGSANSIVASDNFTINVAQPNVAPEWSSANLMTLVLIGILSLVRGHYARMQN